MASRRVISLPAPMVLAGLGDKPVFRQSVLIEFLTFALFYFILKAVLLIVNIEMRRNNLHVPAAVAGLFA